MLCCGFNINDSDKQAESHLIRKVNLVTNHRMQIDLNYSLLLVKNLHFILISAFKNAFKLGCDSSYCVFYILFQEWRFHLLFEMVTDGGNHPRYCAPEGKYTQLLFQLLKSWFI